MVDAGTRIMSIFVLGDLHYPDFTTATTNPDVHDRYPPGDLPGTLGIPLGAVLSASLVSQLSRASNPVVLLCGDVTSRGDADGYREGLEYLAGVLTAPAVASKMQEHSRHLVPGNHDIAYKLPGGTFVSFEDTDRFQPLRDAVKATDLGDILAVESRRTDVTSGPARLSILSLNSSLGSGAPRRFSSAAAAAGSVDMEEVLDIPILIPRQLADVQDLLQSDPEVLPILLAHHALLPQYIPRLNPYTEMVNAGQVREALSSANRPVLYVHGHIHADVVEVVRAMDGTADFNSVPPLVAVSAPELKDGFQQLDIHFTPDGLAVGLEVIRWRLHPGAVNVVADPNRRRIPLSQPSAGAGARREIIRYMADNQVSSGAELINFGSSLHPPLNELEIETQVELLVWRGVLEPTEVVARLEFARKGFRLS